MSGHRMGTAEVESALCCMQIAEAAVVGYPHEIKGQVFTPTSRLWQE